MRSASFHGGAATPPVKSPILLPPSCFNGVAEGSWRVRRIRHPDVSHAHLPVFMHHPLRTFHHTTPHILRSTIRSSCLKKTKAIWSHRVDATSVHTTCAPCSARTWRFLGSSWALLASCYLQLVFRKLSHAYSGLVGSVSVDWCAISLGRSADTTQVSNDQATLQYPPSAQSCYLLAAREASQLPVREELGCTFVADAGTSGRSPLPCLGHGCSGRPLYKYSHVLSSRTLSFQLPGVIILTRHPQDIFTL